VTKGMGQQQVRRHAKAAQCEHHQAMWETNYTEHNRTAPMRRASN
jgi:hypothetical protein